MNNIEINKENITPSEGRVVVLPDPAPSQTKSGIIIPDSVKQPPSSGVVTHIGPNPIFKKGDHVLFMKNAGVELNIDPVHILMREEDIYATI